MITICPRSSGPFYIVNGSLLLRHTVFLRIFRLICKKEKKYINIPIEASLNRAGAKHLRQAAQQRDRHKCVPYLLSKKS